MDMVKKLIKTNTYEREKSNQITYEDNKKNIDVSILKEPYILDFLNLSLNYKEKDLEQSIIDNMSKFLLELGVNSTIKVTKKARIIITNFGS